MKTQYTYTIRIAVLASLFGHGLALAGPLGLSQQALEIREGTDPNVFILVDDSGSMDFEAMTADANNGFVYSGLQRDGSNGGTGTFLTIYDDTTGYLDTTSNEYCDNTLVSAGISGYYYGWHFNNATYPYQGTDLGGSTRGYLCGVAYFDMWRFRNKDFNSLYYDPSKTYTPWPGLDADANVFANISLTAMPQDPYPSTKETVSIDTPYRHWQLEGTSSNYISVEDMSKTAGFVYYDWTDDGDGEFDDGEQILHSLGSATAEERQNFANWFGYYRSRELLTKGVLARALESVTNVNLGYATLHDNNSVKLKLTEMNPSPTTGNKKLLFDKIFSTTPYSGTPLLTAFNNVGKYFECASGNMFGATGADCPIATTTANACRQNYAIVITDGVYGDSVTGINNADSGKTTGSAKDDNDTDYDGGAFADGVGNTMADIAMHYYERDLNTSLANNVPVTTLDVARSALVAGDTMHQHLKTYIIGFGVKGTLNSEPSDYDDPSTWAEAWTNPTSGDDLHKIDDLRHAAYNGRGLYLSAKNSDELEDSLSAIFESIELGTASSSSVALNTQSLEQGSKVFRAFYNVGDNTGEVVALDISVNGVISTTEEWSAASQLDNIIDNNQRVVISYKKDGVNTGGINFATANMTASQLSALETPTPSNMPGSYGGIIADERVDYLKGATTNEGSNFNDGEFRDRLENKGRLGDIVHSSPVFVGAPHGSSRNSAPYPIDPGELYSTFAATSAVKNRTQMLYIGANDGMLHGFNATNGKEVFAYVPGQLYNNLADLSNPNYAHKMYVDLTPTIEDVYIRTTATASSQDWATVLVGGYRAGGKGYFALNITNPNNLDSAAEAVNQVMWEFTEADDADLGYSYSEAFMGMTNAESGTTSSVDSGTVDGLGNTIFTTINNKQWGVIFGNGYNSTSTDGDAALYILKVDGGLDHDWTDPGDYIKISTGKGKAESADGLTPNGLSGIRAVDLDANGTVDYVYAGDYQGNLFRFDLTDSNTSNWNVKLLFSAQIPTTTVKISGVTTIVPGVDYPITIRPFVVDHPSETGVIVVAATGSWITSADATSSTVQTIYGIRDDFSATPTVVASDLVQQAYTLETNIINGFKIRELSNNTINWKNKDGWYINLSDAKAGERALQLQTRGGIGFATTITPKSATSCGSDIESYILAFDPTTGGVPSLVVFDLNGDNVFNDSDKNGADLVAGIGLGQSSSPTKIISNLMIIPLNDGTLKTMGVQVGSTNLDGRLSWRELEVPAGAY